jgi:hypothetical protein
MTVIELMEFGDAGNLRRDIGGGDRKEFDKNWIPSERSLSEVGGGCCLSVCHRPSNPNLKLSAI